MNYIEIVMRFNLLPPFGGDVKSTLSGFGRVEGTPCPVVVHDSIKIQIKNSLQCI